MNQLLNFTIPSWLELDELEVLSIELQSHDQNHAIVVVGENLDETKSCSPTIRLYLAERVDQTFECVKELDAYVFKTKEEAIAFSKKLPQLSALQLILEKQTSLLFT